MKLNYAASAAITCTLTSLANGSARQSLVVDNSANLYLDALVGGSVKTAAGTLAANAVVSVYVYALTDGANYTDGASGADAAFTMPAAPNLILARQISVNTAASVAYCAPFSVATLFGGTLPAKYGVVMQNGSGLALDATLPGSLSYTGVLTQ